MTNTHDNNLSGGSTGSGQIVMGGASNTLTMTDMNSDITQNYDMAQNGTGNTLIITNGTQAASSTIEVGDGTITIGSNNGSNSDTTIAGRIITDADSSRWTIESGTITGSLIAGSGGSGDYFDITGNAVFSGSGRIELNSVGDATHRSNTVVVGGTTSFTDNSSIIATTDYNDIVIQDSASFGDSSSIEMTGNENTVTVRDNASFDGSAAITMTGNDNVVSVEDNASFAGNAAITITGQDNYLRIGDNAAFGATTTIDVSGGSNHIRVEDYAVLPEGMTITMADGNNVLDLYLGNATAFDSPWEMSNDIALLGGNNTLNVGANTHITGGVALAPDPAGNNTYNFHESSTFSPDWEIVGNNNRLNITEAADFNGSINFTGGGTIATVYLTRWPDDHAAPAMTGQIVFANTTGTTAANTVNIRGGVLTSQYGSAIASNVVDTNFNVSGSITNLLVSGYDTGSGPKSTYNITGGQVYNIRQQDGSMTAMTGGDWVTDYVAKDDLNVTHSVDFGRGWRTTFQSYSILNVDTLTTWAASSGAKTITSIGGFTSNVWLEDTISNQSNSWGQGDYGNQLTANTVTVNPNSKLILHEDATRMGGDDLGDTVDQTIVNVANVSGEMTIDRGSVHSSGSDGTAVINVMNGGILYGFGEYNDVTTDHNPMRAQLYGTLTLNTGATLQPYDMGLSSAYFQYGLRNDLVDNGLFAGWDYDTFHVEHRGGVFQVDAENGNGGDTIFMTGSTIRSRLFDWGDSRTVDLWTQGDSLDTQFSDSLLTVSADFSNVLARVENTSGMAAQAAKAQFDVVFGFQYDLKSKQEFQIYADENSPDKTYYYAVVNGDEPIAELAGYDDANHLFNRLILKSDMLGQYNFFKTDDDTGIYLRYRMLAYHPTQGGIKRTMEEYGHRNDITPGQYLDEIRYPFSGQPGSDLNGVLPADPSATDSYNDAGYNGNMWGDGDGFYANPNLDPVFDNVQEAWIKDWENLFQGMQLAVESNATLYSAVRMLHSETYANISQTAFDAMSQFVRNRERNAVSALFQVENDLYERAAAEADGALASLTLDMDRPDFFVCNPIRFWASGWGAYGRQMRSGSGEMGYDHTVWGGSLGVIKELGDYYLGATIGYADTEAKYDGSAVKTKSYLAEGLVGARIFCLGFAELYAGYSHNENANGRVVDLASDQVGGYYGVAKGEFSGKVLSAGFRLGYQKVLGENWLFVPTIGFNVMHHRAEAFVEGGRYSMANRMAFDKKSMDRTLYRVPVEFRLNRAIALGSFILQPELRAGIAGLFGDTRGEARAKWVGNPIDNRYFTSVGVDRGSYEGWVGATLELSRRGRFYIAANYDFVYAANYTSHNYALQGGMNF